jgi:hypothetical protein
MSRLTDLVRFYALLDRLAYSVGGPRTLASLGSYRDWPTRGVYFFFEDREVRRESGTGSRVVRVGTCAHSRIMFDSSSTVSATSRAQFRRW